MFPFSRRVVIEIKGLSKLTAAIEKLAEARVTAAETLRGHRDPIPSVIAAPPAPTSEYEARYRAALAGLSVDENRRRHLAGALAVLLGRQAVPSWTTMADVRQDVEDAGLPLPG